MPAPEPLGSNLQAIFSLRGKHEIEALGRENLGKRRADA